MNEPVVVLAVDEVYRLDTMLVRGQVEEVANPVCFFADIITASRETSARRQLNRGGSRHGATNATYSFSIKSCKCLRAKLTGCAPGNPNCGLPSSCATSLLRSWSSWPSALIPGLSILSMGFDFSSMAVVAGLLVNEWWTLRADGVPIYRFRASALLEA